MSSLLAIPNIALIAKIVCIVFFYYHIMPLNNRKIDIQLYSLKRNIFPI